MPSSAADGFQGQPHGLDPLQRFDPRESQLTVDEQSQWLFYRASIATKLLEPFVHSQHPMHWWPHRAVATWERVELLAQSLNVGVVPLRA